MGKQLYLPLLLLALITGIPGQAQSEPTPAPTQDPPATEETTDETLEPVEEVAPGPDLTDANELILEGSYAEAEVLLAELSVEFPEDPGLLLVHGEVLLALRKTDEALEQLQKSAEIKPAQPRVHFQIASALASQGKTDEAFEEFAKEIEHGDNDRILTLARLNRSMILGNNRDWAGSAAELEEALKLDSSQVQAYGDLISLYIQANDLDNAADAIARGKEAGFVSATHYYSLGARLYSTKRDEEAVAAFTEALAVDPSLSRAERSLAAVLERLGRKEEATAHLRRYLELAPDAPDAAQVAAKLEAVE
jgi:tetratricopeptide (TPR) repeat protein